LRGSRAVVRLGLTATVLVAVVGAGCGGPSASETARDGGAPALPRPLPASSGRTFYVSPRGSDHNPGTSARPWRTIGKALSMLAPGQRALVRAGLYTESLIATRSGTAKAPITIANAPGERPILRPAPGAAAYPLEVWNAAYLRFSGLVIEGAVGSSTANVFVAGTSSHVEISRCVVRDSEQQGVFTARTTHDVSLLQNRIYDNGRPGEPDQNHGIYLEGTGHLVADNVVYDQPHGFGIQLYPDANRVLVVDNTIVGNSLGGIVIGGNGSTTVSHSVIANNVSAFNGGPGIVGYYRSGPVGNGNVAVANLVWGNVGGSVELDAAPTPVVSLSATVDADPRFVDRTGGDFRLRAGSPALDRAASAYSTATDARGIRRPQGRGYDIGAFERTE